MADVQVTCITTRTGSLEGITHIGGTGGSGWKWAIADVIRSIESNTNTFYTLVSGNRAEIGVVNGSGGKYLRTYADGKWNDNLLSLPQCP